MNRRVFRFEALESRTLLTCDVVNLSSQPNGANFATVDDTTGDTFEPLGFSLPGENVENGHCYQVSLNEGDVFSAVVLGEDLALRVFEPATAPGEPGFVQGERKLESVLPLGAQFETPQIVGERSGLTAYSQLAFIAASSGSYTFHVFDDANLQRTTAADYEIDFQTVRPFLETQPADSVQYVFLDFDGGTALGTSLTGVSDPVGGSTLVERWKMKNQDVDNTDIFFDSVVNTVEENFSGLGDIKLLTNESWQELGWTDEPWGRPNVQRVVIGHNTGSSILDGTAEEARDIGNYATTSTVRLVLDGTSGSSPARTEMETICNNANPDPDLLGGCTVGTKDFSSKADFVGTAIGNLVSHELAHEFGASHTSKFVSVPAQWIRGLACTESPRSITDDGGGRTDYYIDGSCAAPAGYAKLGWEDNWMDGPAFGYAGWEYGEDGIISADDSFTDLEFVKDFYNSPPLVGKADSPTLISKALSTGQNVGPFLEIETGVLKFTGSAMADVVSVDRVFVNGEYFVRVTYNVSGNQVENDFKLAWVRSVEFVGTVARTCLLWIRICSRLVVRRT